MGGSHGGASGETSPAGSLILNLQNFSLHPHWGNKFLLFKLPSLWYFAASAGCSDLPPFSPGSCGPGLGLAEAGPHA